MNATVSQLQSMSCEELSKYIRNMPSISMEQKRSAWKHMDTGIYDKNGNLVGDKCEKEDRY